MNFIELEKNIDDVIKEQLIKLGYMEGSVRLYYPLESLNGTLETQLNSDEMLTSLKEYFTSNKGHLGPVSISVTNKRFCFIVPKEGVKHIHEHMEENSFLSEFIQLMSTASPSLEDVLNTFRKHSNSVICQEETHGEFDYLIYFENGQPDAFRYCFKFDDHHTIYHRFTSPDYHAFRF